MRPWGGPGEGGRTPPIPPEPLLTPLSPQSLELGGSPGPAPPALPALGVAGRDLAALATAFGVTDLWDPRGALDSGGPRALTPCGPLAPPVRHGLRQLLQVGRLGGCLGPIGEVWGEVCAP